MYPKISIILLSILFLSGCTSYTVSKKSSLQKQEQEIVELKNQKTQIEQEKQNIEQKYSDLKEGKESEISNSKFNRVSVGGAQAIAVYGTLRAEPNKTKYTDAAIKGLSVTQNALQDLVSTKDLLLAIETQSNLISEQAEQIKKGNETINELNNNINIYKNNEQKLNNDIENLEAQKIKEVGIKLIEIKEKDNIISQKERLLKEQEDKFNNLNAEKAAKFDKENSLFNRLNPFTHLSKFFSSIFIWIIIFVVLGVILKVCSIIFPGVNVLQVIVKGIGSVVGGILKLIFGFIPNLFSGLGAVDKKEYEKEKKIADNTIGSIQELKYENPELYNQSVKPKLQEWHQNDPEIDKIIEQKLKDLNLK